MCCRTGKCTLCKLRVRAFFSPGMLLAEAVMGLICCSVLKWDWTTSRLDLVWAITKVPRLNYAAWCELLLPVTCLAVQIIYSSLKKINNKKSIIETEVSRDATHARAHTNTHAHTQTHKHNTQSLFIPENCHDPCLKDKGFLFVTRPITLVSGVGFVASGSLLQWLRQKESLWTCRLIACSSVPCVTPRCLREAKEGRKPWETQKRGGLVIIIQSLFSAWKSLEFYS